MYTKPKHIFSFYEAISRETRYRLVHLAIGRYGFKGLCRRLGISPGTLAKWQKGILHPCNENLERLINLLLQDRMLRNKTLEMIVIDIMESLVWSLNFVKNNYPEAIDRILSVASRKFNLKVR